MIGKYMVWRHNSGRYSPVIVVVLQKQQGNEYLVRNVDGGSEGRRWGSEPDRTFWAFAEELTP